MWLINSDAWELRLVLGFPKILNPLVSRMSLFGKQIVIAEK